MVILLFFLSANLIGCELKLVSTLQEISYLREEIGSLKKKVINLIIMHLCGPLASSCTFLLSNKSVQKEIFCVLLVFIIFLSCIFLPEGCVRHDKMFEEITKVCLATFGCLFLCSLYKDAGCHFN